MSKFVTRPLGTRYKRRLTREACNAASEVSMAVAKVFRDAAWEATSRKVNPQNDPVVAAMWKCVEAAQEVEDKYDTLYKLTHGIAVLKSKEEKYGSQL